MNEIIVNPPREKWRQLIQRPQFNTVELDASVSEIIESVKQKGDEALKKYALQFDGFAPENLLVSPDEILAAGISIGKGLKKAIRTAKKNIEKFHQGQKEDVKEIETMPGVVCWQKSIPVENVGLYIPGGTAPLFSTLLMLAIPAQIAGCDNIVVCTPANANGTINVVILFVAQLLGIKKIYKLGGAQAIAAMAYGTQSVEKVDKIFGPGNQFVTSAKKLVNLAGVAIDMLAGPSELAVYADETCIPGFVAADLLSQAEHGTDSQVVLVANKQQIITAVIEEVNNQIHLLPRKDIIEKSLSNSRFVVIGDIEEAFDFLNTYAPEHLIIASKNARKIAKYVKNAGSVFIGNYSPESAGDYASGTNHSLPTNGLAKTQGGVSISSFMKKVTFQEISKKGIRNIGATVEKMAAAEGLDAHKNAASIRLKKK
ncbi:MAG: histidinol dehydrogenase [Ginsengibacter sp.]